jgi:hypothetical protein
LIAALSWSLVEDGFHKQTVTTDRLWPKAVAPGHINTASVSFMNFTFL